MTKRKLTKHDDDTCPHLVRASLLEAENARLIDEVDLMHSSKLVYFIHGEGRWANVVEENARLKAEVERLTNENGNNFVLKEEWYLKCLSARADVERLRKAGDIIARIIAPPAHGPGEWDGEWYAWHNAKSGVLSAETPPNTPPPAL